MIPNYNHPSRTAESVARLDLISDGRVEFGIGEGATRLGLHGYGIPAKEKRELSPESAEQIANMMVMDPYPGFEGQSFSMPCRNVLPKPLQKPHPPMWMACTNRDTIRKAASIGVGAPAFSFVDQEEAKTWDGWLKFNRDILSIHRSIASHQGMNQANRSVIQLPTKTVSASGRSRRSIPTSMAAVLLISTT